MSLTLYAFLSGVIGIVTGFFTIHSPLTHSSLSVILWIVVGIVIVSFSSDQKMAVRAGAVFGFFTIVSWLITGFQGGSHQLGGFLLLTLAFSILGAMIGALGGYTFYKVLSAVKHKKS